MKIFDKITNRLSRLSSQNLSYENARQVYGGDINSTFILETTAGNFFIKLNRAAYQDMFQKEYEGLNLLASANSVKVPQPILHGNSGDQIFLVMELIEKGSQNKNFWTGFASGLATIHKHSAAYFGLNLNNYIGLLPQSNKKHGDWASFYAEERIMPLVMKAHSQDKLLKKEVELAEKLCDKFSFLLPDEKPSLLHGDLWSGNFTADKNGEPVIYDPAVYYGHREMDVAMTKLFGGFDRNFYDYYNEAFPLQAGWQQRLDLFQLYPLLVHLILFGGDYYGIVIDIFRKYN